MTVAHLLHCIGREDPGSVHCLVINGIPLENCHEKKSLRRAAHGPRNRCAVMVVVNLPLDDVGTAVGRPNSRGGEVMGLCHGGQVVKV